MLVIEYKYWRRNCPEGKMKLLSKLFIAQWIGIDGKRIAIN